MQKVLLTLFIALLASGLIEFYKNFIQRADDDINGAYRPHPAATATP